MNKQRLMWTFAKFKATGGGPRVKEIFSSTFTYVIALLILFPKWAHLPLNSKRLLRYDSSKLGHFRPFSSICIGKLPKFAYKFLHFFKNLSHQILQLTPNLVSTLRDIKSRNACNGFLIFWFSGILRDFSGEIFGLFRIFAKTFTRKVP